MRTVAHSSPGLVYFSFLPVSSSAEVAELADAQASGACCRKAVEVRVLSSAPDFAPLQLAASFGELRLGKPAFLRRLSRRSDARNASSRSVAKADRSPPACRILRGATSWQASVRARSVAPYSVRHQGARGAGSARASATSGTSGTHGFSLGSTRSATWIGTARPDVSRTRTPAMMAILAALIATCTSLPTYGPTERSSFDGWTRTRCVTRRASSGLRG